jgi:site-specific DNA recombinase
MIQPIQAAIYARVSSEHQADAQTIASQVAALHDRVTADGLVVPAALRFLDDGYSGATLVRPALERLRDAAATGAIDRLYVHSPDRLARKYAYQVLLVEELRRLGVEVIFLNRELGRSPEDDLLLQVQGMMAEYERAKIVERHRRGKLHAARSGAVNVLSGAPYGYRYVNKHDGGGQARYDVLPEEARVVRQVFAWVGRDRLSIGEVCRRLMQAGERTRTGRTVWERSVVWAMLKNPAYMGSAAFGKTRQGPLRPKLRAQRGRPLQPRRAATEYEVPVSDWMHIPVPAIVEPEVFAAVEEQLQENRRHARQSQRGARYLLQGLLQCQHCGYAFYGKPLSPSARKGRERAYAYYRCLGTDAYRFGGERLCPNTQVRTDRLELAVWHEVCALLAHPERLAQEFHRRLHADGQQHQQERRGLESQGGKLQQGLARLIDSYAEGLIDKQEFEPRVKRLRQRMAQIDAQCQQLAEEEALQRELQLIIGRLDEFAAQVTQNLEELEWSRKRDIIRALVRRVEIALDQVQVVFRVDAFAGESDPEKKSLQLCKRSTLTRDQQHGVGRTRSRGMWWQVAPPGPQHQLCEMGRRLHRHGQFAAGVRRGRPAPD